VIFGFLFWSVAGRFMIILRKIIQYDHFKKIISSIYVTEEEFITASGTLQTNIDSKPDTLLDLIDTPDAYDDEK